MLDDCKSVWQINKQSEYLEIESDHPDPAHFKSYPHAVTYSFNSRGFRGAEWPSDLHNAIWCLGDSFTSATGAPESHAWWRILEKATGRTCINISLDGVSNDWIARWAARILDEVAPKDMIIQWSFTHRRELPLLLVQDRAWQEYYSQVRDPSWPDCDSFCNVKDLPLYIQQELKTHYPGPENYGDSHDFEMMRRTKFTDTTTQEDAEHTQSLVHHLESIKKQTRILHSHVPRWHTTALTCAGQWVREFNQIDYAKDARHYDIKTAELFVSRVLEINDYQGIV